MIINNIRNIILYNIHIQNQLQEIEDKETNNSHF